MTVGIGFPAWARGWTERSPKSPSQCWCSIFYIESLSLHIEVVIQLLIRANFLSALRGRPCQLQMPQRFQKCYFLIIDHINRILEASLKYFFLFLRTSLRGEREGKGEAVLRFPLPHMFKSPRADQQFLLSHRRHKTDLNFFLPSLLTTGALSNCRLYLLSHRMIVTDLHFLSVISGSISRS